MKQVGAQKTSSSGSYIHKNRLSHEYSSDLNHHTDDLGRSGNHTAKCGTEF